MLNEYHLGYTTIAGACAAVDFNIARPHLCDVQALQDHHAVP